MSWQEYLLTIPMIWIIAAWLVALVLIALAKVYLSKNARSKPSFLARIPTLLALSLPLLVAFRITGGTIEQGSFLLSSIYLFGIGLGGIGAGAAIVRLIVSVIGGQPQSERERSTDGDSDEVLLNGKPLDDF